jgi:hypothetical protein
LRAVPSGCRASATLPVIFDTCPAEAGIAMAEAITGDNSTLKKIKPVIQYRFFIFYLLWC